MKNLPDVFLPESHHSSSFYCPLEGQNSYAVQLNKRLEGVLSLLPGFCSQGFWWVNNSLHSVCRFLQLLLTTPSCIKSQSCALLLILTPSFQPVVRQSRVMSDQRLHPQTWMCFWVAVLVFLSFWGDWLWPPGVATTNPAQSDGLRRRFQLPTKSCPLLLADTLLRTVLSFQERLWVRDNPAMPDVHPVKSSPRIWSPGPVCGSSRLSIDIWVLMDSFYPLTFRVFLFVAIFMCLDVFMLTHAHLCLCTVFTCITAAACDSSSVFLDLCTVQLIRLPEEINMQQLAAGIPAHGVSII